MPRLLSEPDLIRVQIRLPKSDYRRLLSMANAAQDTNIGVSTIIRQVIRTWLNINEAQVRSRIDATTGRPPILELEDLEL